MLLQDVDLPKSAAAPAERKGRAIGVQTSRPKRASRGLQAVPEARAMGGEADEQALGQSSLQVTAAAAVEAVADTGIRARFQASGC